MLRVGFVLRSTEILPALQWFVPSPNLRVLWVVRPSTRSTADVLNWDWRKKNWCFPLSWKGNFPVGTKIDRGEKFKGSQKNCRLRNFIHSRKKKSPRENLCGQNRWFETSRNFSSQQQKIIGMKNIAECYKNWAIGDFMLTRERSPEIPASIVICAWAMAVFQ